MKNSTLNKTCPQKACKSSEADTQIKVNWHRISSTARQGNQVQRSQRSPLIKVLGKLGVYLVLKGRARFY